MNQAPINENKGYITPSETASLPATFGVYLMKNEQAKVIYVGKAKNLKKRVSSYFQKKHGDTKTQRLVEHIALIDYITVSSEAEALLLEANLIKKYKPRYNVDFKDNKFYPFIRVTAHETFPRIMFARHTPKDGSVYFGPYPSAHVVRRLIDLIQKLFKIRTCAEMPKRVCLNYHMHYCSGPCEEFISEADYREQLEQAIRFLKGEYGGLIETLEKDMREAAGELLFEKAQVLKEKIEAIRLFEQSQNVILSSAVDADFLGWSSRMGRMLFVVNMVRAGRMVGKRSFTASLNTEWEAGEEEEEEANEVVSRFLMEYYRDSDKKARYMIIDNDYAAVFPVMNQYFRELENAGVEVRAPQDEAEQALVKMARENAQLHLVQVLSKVEESQGLNQLAEALELSGIPMRIEGFDIANILGEQAVASLISFYGGKPDKKNYRTFKIRGKSTPDDFAMMREAVFRRYRRLKEEQSGFPDLILVDGGKGQLNAALDALQELDLNLPIVSLAKKNEEIYLPGRSDPLVLNKNSPALHVLQRVRDETHRFANRYYNKLKGKELMKSIFDGIEGIGEKRKKIIMEKFLDRKKVGEMGVEELIQEGIPRSIAEKVYNKLKELYN